MVESDVCSVLPSSIPNAPKPVIIPLTFGQKDLYLKDFVRNLNAARDMLDTHLKSRKL